MNRWYSAQRLTLLTSIQFILEFFFMKLNMNVNKKDQDKYQEKYLLFKKKKRASEWVSCACE